MWFNGRVYAGASLAVVADSRHPVFDGVVFESFKPNTKERLVHTDWYQQAGEMFINHVYHVANSLKSTGQKWT